MSDTFRPFATKRKTRKGDRAANIITYCVLIFYAILQMFPFLIILITAFSTEELLLRGPGFRIPGFSDLTFANFATSFTNKMAIVYVGDRPVNSLLLGFVNTLWQVLPTTILGLFFSGLAGYAYAKMDFLGKKTMFALQIAIIALPLATLTMPSYLFYYTIGWTDSVLPVMIPGMFGNAVMIFYLSQYFRGLPDEVVEAARLDGLNSFLLYVRIVMPLAVPAFVAQGVLSFVGGYNNFMGPLLYITKDTLFPLQLVLYNVVNGYNPDMFAGVICASTLIAMLPLIIVYIFGRSWFRFGITAGAVKS